MDEKKQCDVASKGGRAAHEKGTAHEWIVMRPGLPEARVVKPVMPRKGHSG